VPIRGYNSRHSRPVAIASALNFPVHGRENRVDQADAFFANALDHARDLFASGTPIIGVCASGILIRGVAPLLADKTTEPPVISVSDDGKIVVPLLGGHHGANRLARDIADALHGTAAVTTAGDVALGVSLDEPPLGYRLQNPENAKSVMATLLSGGGVTWNGAPIFDAQLPAGNDVELCVTESPEQGNETRLVYHPQRFTLGLGCARNADPADLWDLVEGTLKANNIAHGAIACVASIDLKADEPAILQAAQKLGVPLRLFTAAELETESPRLANPSDVVFAEVGCHGVSEGAALAAAGTDATLSVEKSKARTGPHHHATWSLAWSPFGRRYRPRASGVAYTRSVPPCR
jgi:cobalt-precorrin 5A hydrolase/precorrin-3B C17-methyltransferase